MKPAAFEPATTPAIDELQTEQLQTPPTTSEDVNTDYFSVKDGSQDTEDDEMSKDSTFSKIKKIFRFNSTDHVDFQQPKEIAVPDHEEEELRQGRNGNS
ncbi:hypothetical protein WICPIJ_006499, partial [Wickerhamomyces pijperi]